MKDDYGRYARAGGWTIEGPLVIKDQGSKFTPRGWDRLFIAIRALRGKPIIGSSGGASIADCLFEVPPGNHAITRLLQ